MPSSLSIECSGQGSSQVYRLSGRIDTVTAPQLAANIHLDGVQDATLDLANVDYVSSAGLRVFLQAQTAMNKSGGAMHIINCQPHIKGLFDAVGFTAIMDVS